jgi:hypothetical protein
MIPNNLAPADAIRTIAEMMRDPNAIYHTEITYNKAGEVAEVKVIRIGRVLE